MGGAAEAILEELLAANTQQVVLLKSISAKLGGGGGGGGDEADKNYKNAGKSAGIFSKALGAAGSMLGGAFHAAGMAASVGLGALSKTTSALIENQMALSQGAIEGTNSLHSMTASLEGLPFGLGFLAKVMTMATEKMEVNLRTYQQISETGARLGTNLSDVRLAAAGMGLSMQEFADVMVKAGPQLRYFGSTTSEGAKNLIAFNQAFVMGKDGAGKGLLGLGYSLTEANGLLAQYSEAVGGIQANQMKDQKTMQQSVKAFGEELDASAQLEGKSREQKAEEMKQASQNAAIQAKLATMGPEEIAKYNQAMNSAARIGGKGAQELVQSQLLGLPPMTKASQQFAAMNAKAAQTVQEQTRVITDGTKAADAKAKLDQLDAKGRAQSADMYNKNSKVMGALSLSNSAMADTVNAAAQNSADMSRKGQKTEADVLDNKKKIRAEQAAAEKSAIGGLVQQTGAAKNAGGLMDLLANALRPLFPIIEKLIGWFAKILPDVINFGGDLIKKVIVPAFNTIFGGVSIDSILKPFKDFWKGLTGGLEGGGVTFTDLRDGIVNFVKPITDFIGEVVSSIDWEEVGAKFREAFIIVGEIIGDIWKVVKNLFSGEGGNLGETLGTAFDSLMTGIHSLLDGIMYIVDLFVKSPLFETLKKMFTKFIDLISDVVDVVVSIVKSPVGTFLMNTLFDVFGFFGDIINSIIDAIDGAIEIIAGVYKFITGDFKGGWEKIKSGVTKIFTGIVEFLWSIPKLIGNVLIDATKSFVDAVKGILASIVDGIKSIGKGIVNFFTGGGDKTPAEADVKKAAAALPPITKEAQAAAATTTAQKTPKTATPTPPAPAAHKAAEDKKASADEAAANAKTTSDLAKAKDPMEILRVEMQALNKQTTEMIRYLRENVAATKSLNKNLYPT